MKLIAMALAAGISAWLTISSPIGQLYQHVTFEACTKSEQLVRTNFTVDTPAEHKTETTHIQEAFKETANNLTTAELQAQEGFVIFIGKLTDADKAVLAAVEFPEVVKDATCKVE